MYFLQLFSNFFVDQQISILFFPGAWLPFPFVNPTVIKFDPAIAIFYQGVVMSRIWRPNVDDEASQPILGRYFIWIGKFFWKIFREVNLKRVIDWVL